MIIAAMAAGEVESRDWWKIIGREIATGFLLGMFLGILAVTPALLLAPTMVAASVVPLTILVVVLCGTFSGSVLPLVFRHLGWDPALMSNPFVAGIMDITGIVAYVSIARAILV